MIEWRGKRVPVFHAGALGDFVLIWPLLRALMRAGAVVTAIADSSKAKLAAVEIGVEVVGSDRPWVAALWREAADPSNQFASGTRADVIVSFVADGTTDVGRRWLSNARRVLGATEVLCIGPPGSSSRAALWEQARALDLGRVEPRANPTGPIVLHVGAGSREKQWPLDRWFDVAVQLRGRGRPVEVLAGEAEAERFTTDQKGVLAAMNGRVLWSLDELAAAIRPASLFVGCDTGPTHLAAQLGVPSLALFGPTDPAIWSPVGPQVTVVRPPSPGPMDWLTVDRVLAAVP
jgi:heptosyltransferase-3